MKNCICIVLWHNNQSLFEELINNSNLDIFVISHKSIDDIPHWLNTYVNSEHIFIEPNIGYDWGAYQQFLEKKIYLNYSSIFFSHDDLLIKDNLIFNYCLDIIEANNGYCIVGNGLNNKKRDWPLTHIHCYAHSKWKPPSWNFCHDTMRGSFFGTSSNALKIIDNFEVYWDHFKFLGVGAGNWSLRATCGKIQEILGENSFQFLSQNYRDTPFLIEMERGKLNNSLNDKHQPLNIRYLLIYRISKFLMTWYMDTNNKNIKNYLSIIMSFIFNKL